MNNENLTPYKPGSKRTIDNARKGRPKECRSQTREKEV